MTLSLKHKEEDFFTHTVELNARQQAEEDFYRTSETENASSDLHKSLFIRVQSLLFFEDILKKYPITFTGNFLELGGGFGYLSSYIKKKNNDVTVFYSDVSREAVKKSRQYEDFFQTKIDQKWVTAAEETPFEDQMFDCVLFFASFHHVQQPDRVVKECSRILKPGGKLFLLMEPCCPKLLRKIHEWYTRRETVMETSFSLSEYRRFFQEADLAFTHYNYKNYAYRWRKTSMLYYLGLNLIPDPLTRFLPCTQVIVGEKPFHD